MSTEDFTPSLDQLVFFEGDAIAEVGGDVTKTSTVATGITDPTNDGIVGDDDDDTTKIVTDTSDDDDVSDDDNVDDSDDNDDDDTADNDDDDTSDDDDDDSPSPLRAQFDFLMSNNLLMLPEDFEYEDSEEGFQKAVEASQGNVEMAGANMVWNKLSKDFQTILEYGLAGGNDVNKVREVINGQMKLDDVDIETESDQVDILRAYLKKTTRYSDARIDKSISRLKSLNELEEEADAALGELKEIYTAEREELAETAKQEKADQKQRMEDSYTSFVDVVSKEAGINKTTKDKIVRSIWTTGDYGDYKGVSYFNYIDASVKSNPQHLAQLAQLYLDYDPKKGFDTDKIKRKAKTEVNKTFKSSLDTLLNSSGKPKVRGGKVARTSKSSGNATEDLEKFLKHSR